MSMLTDCELFSLAEWHARTARRWRALAASGGDERHTPRQAASLALKSERRVLDLSISAEKRCERALEAQGRWV